MRRTTPLIFLLAFVLIPGINLFSQNTKTGITNVTEKQVKKLNKAYGRIALAKVKAELGIHPWYDLIGSGIISIGPQLWARYQKMDSLESVQGNKSGDSAARKAKLNTNGPDFKPIWDQLRKEAGRKGYKIRALKPKEIKRLQPELPFYTSEYDPVIMLKTKEYCFILKFVTPPAVDSMRLHWIEQLIDFKSYIYE